MSATAVHRVNHNPAVYTAARTALQVVRTGIHVLRAVAAGIKTFLSFFRW